MVAIGFLQTLSQARVFKPQDGGLQSQQVRFNARQLAAATLRLGQYGLVLGGAALSQRLPLPCAGENRRRRAIGGQALYTPSAIFSLVGRDAIVSASVAVFVQALRAVPSAAVALPQGRPVTAPALAFRERGACAKGAGAEQYAKCPQVLSPQRRRVVPG